MIKDKNKAVFYVGLAVFFSAALAIAVKSNLLDRAGSLISQATEGGSTPRANKYTVEKRIKNITDNTPNNPQTRRPEDVRFVEPGYEISYEIEISRVPLCLSELKFKVLCLGGRP